MASIFKVMNKTEVLESEALMDNRPHGSRAKTQPAHLNPHL